MCTGKVILEAAILTTVVVFSLTAYTFWAVKRGKDFSFLGPFLFASLIMLLVFGFVQVRYDAHLSGFSILQSINTDDGFSKYTDLLPAGQALSHDLWRAGGTHLQWLHCL